MTSPFTRSAGIAGLAFAHVVLVVPYVLRLVIAAATGFDRSIAQAAESPDFTILEQL